MLQLELPIDRLNGPIELLAKSLGKEFLNWNIKLLGENNGKARINVILQDC
jgi:hypothetical protein